MASSTVPKWSSMEDSEYAAAESMVQHSRSARSNSSAFNGFPLPDPQTYPSPATQSQSQMNPMGGVSLPPYPGFGQPFPSASAQDQTHPFGLPFDGKLPPPHALQGSFEPATRDSVSEIPPGRSSDTSAKGQSGSQPGHTGRLQKDSGSIDGSEPTSPVSARGFSKGSFDGSEAWTQRSNNDAGDARDGTERKPAWSDLKTKAGKERKRLPLACIACRRKKIRCSGEKPTCKHCVRSRIPCVYKVTQRKAAPRTDYMAMLDKRLKRMEERVIKIIPKVEAAGSATIPRAVIKPQATAPANIGKKRIAEEAFGPDSQMDEWHNSKITPASLRGREEGDSRVNTEGDEFLPPAEIQEHLSEIFFDYLYGQSYHLLHKPSYMRRLKSGTVPPVLILAVCAISARFSTHPEVVGEPAFLRGERWAEPARRMSLQRYDEPNITTLTVYLLLGLHEFGTCQGGRSWMFAGMATRMAYALQLHRELDHDPLGRQQDKNSELSFTDREIRRRTMWACFLMDRFNSSGTERPMFADEEIIKAQLPIKESSFQNELAGPTESLEGRVPNPTTDDTGQVSNAKEEMGVAAYMVRIVSLWGRVIKYLNMGGKERDAHPIWDERSGFAMLRQEANDFKSSLPADLMNTTENLKTHAAEKLGSQFLFVHIASNQVVLFLNRFAIPTAPGARNPRDMPKNFVNKAGPLAIEAAAQISMLIKDAWEYRAVAPFLGYCAYMSGTVHVFAIFSNKRWAEVSKDHLKTNHDYLTKMKKYWGMFHFMTENLHNIYRLHHDASLKTEGSSEVHAQDDSVFQYGDWFQKFPHGVSGSDYQDPAANVKKEVGDDAALGHKSDLQSVEDFFHTQSPPARTREHKKPSRKSARRASQPDDPPPYQTDTDQSGMLPMAPSDIQNHMDPSAFTAQHPTQLYPQPCVNSYPQPYDILPLSTPANHALLPQLDRQLVYGAYAGQDPTGSNSASALSALTNDQHNPSSAFSDPSSQIWDSPMGLAAQEQQQQLMMPGGYMGDMSTSAWFMPFNLNPASMAGEGDDLTRALEGFGGGGV